MARGSRRRDDSSCCSFTLIRYSLLFFSFLMIICGVLFLLLAAYLVVFKGYLIPLLQNELYQNMLYLMAAIGSLILMSSFLSCSASSSRCVGGVYTFLLLVILLMEGVLALAALHYSQIVAGEIKVHLEKGVKEQYSIDKDIQWAVDKLQIEGKCCGCRGFEDYPKNETSSESDEEDVPKIKSQYIPDTCCRDYVKGCGKSDHPSNIYYAGCLPYLHKQTQQNMYFICSAALAFLIVQVFATLISCCVCVKGGREEEDMHPFKDRDQEMSLFD